jgi:hypothetical protein
MLKHTWTNRILPPAVFMGVVSCVWYGLASQPQAAVVLPPTRVVAAAPPPASIASAEPIANITPTISRLGKDLQFSLTPKSPGDIEKVEFYVENKLVGAAFAAPFVVRVCQDNLSAGTHTLTAKVYGSGATTQTTPTLFTAQPTAPPQNNAEQESVAPSSKPATPSTLAAPIDLAASAGGDGTSAQLTWAAVAGADSYQVWRDSTQIATVTQANYTDTNLSPGYTYDYQIVATSSDGAVSDPSAQAAVTMPMPASKNNGTNNMNHGSSTQSEESLAPDTGDQTPPPAEQ